VPGRRGPLTRCSGCRPVEVRFHPIRFPACTDPVAWAELPYRSTQPYVSGGRDRLALLLTPALYVGGFVGWTRTIPLHAPAGTDQVLDDRLLAEARWVRTVEWLEAALTTGARAACLSAFVQ
jgi:hypothetical protein